MVVVLLGLLAIVVLVEASALTRPVGVVVAAVLALTVVVGFASGWLEE